MSSVIINVMTLMMTNKVNVNNVLYDLSLMSSLIFYMLYTEFPNKALMAQTLFLHFHIPPSKSVAFIKATCMMAALHDSGKGVAFFLSA